MKNYHKDKTESFFEKSFPKSEKNYFSDDKLTNRDLIIIKKIFPKLLRGDSRVLDFACGKAEMLSWLINTKKVNALGIEKSKGMIDQAIKFNGNKIKENIIKGSVSELEGIKDNSFDIILSIGIFQYLSESDYKKALKNFHRILSPNGVLIATFQNLFFDLFTLNRFTLDFYSENVLFDKIPGITKLPVDLKKYLSKTIPFSSKPLKTTSRARDNIFVRFSNPLTIKDELSNLNFHTKKLYYYDYFGLPPEIKNKFPGFSKKVEESMEITNCEDWRGAFMANAFICELKKK